MKSAAEIPCLSILCLSVLLAVPAFAQQQPDPARVATQPQRTQPAGAPRTPAADSDVVQLAILLDTSGSMNGLIEQAKSQLWQVINDIAKNQVEGQKPDIQVALYQYGTPSLGKENGYIKMLVPLTDDLDLVSAELHKLTTNGGDEYCGAVIKKAAEELKWSGEKGAYKAIFIAGNEPFTQGTVDYHDACKLAISKGIIVHTIFCGNEAEGIRGQWKDGATLADGTYSFIDQNVRMAGVASPQDAQLADLSGKLNATYVPYGAGGLAGAANQAAQDKNAGGLGGAAIAAERAITKANAAYRNANWDLVDAVNAGKVKLEDVKTEDLPEDMRGMDLKARQDYIAQKQKERQDLQAQIKQLSDERDKYIASITPTAGARGATGAGGGAGGFGGGAGGGRGGGGAPSGFGGAVSGAVGRGR